MLIKRCRERIPSMHPEDQEEAIDIIEEVETAMQSQDPAPLDAAGKRLGEFLFFVEGR